MTYRKTVLIFSHSRDQGTNGVAQWLRHAGANVLRFNDDDPRPAAERRVRLSADDCEFECDGRDWRLSDIDAVWYRKGHFWFAGPARPIGFEQDDPTLHQLLARRFQAEIATASRYLYRLVQVRGIRTLGNPVLGDPNKLEMMREARAAGLNIPHWEATTRLSPQHLAHPAAHVGKALSDGVYLWDMDDRRRAYFSYTERLDELLAAGDIEPAVPLSLVQQNVPKSFELRVFHLDGLLHAIAIHSQGDEQTTTDYRKYNTRRPNRNSPFALPHEISQQLREFFRRIDLNTGSVDMIVTPQGEFVFLEVNPYGIYSGISEVGNLNIDRAIARWLCGEQHERTVGAADDTGAGCSAPARVPQDLLQGID